MHAHEKPQIKPARQDDQSAFASRLLLLEKKLEKLRQFLDRIDLLFDSIELEIEQLKRDFVKQPEKVRAVNRRSRLRGRRAARSSDGLLTDAAMDVQFVRRGDGGASVCIDGGKWFTLQPKPAALLGTLLVGPRTGKPDGEWKSYESLAEQLGATGVDSGVRHRIAQLIYLLRNTLEAHGANPDFIETDRRFGARLRLKGNRNSVIWDPPV